MSGADIVSKWQQTLSEESHVEGPAEPHLLAKAYRACILLYSDILAGLLDQRSIQPSVLTSLQRSQDSFKLWAHGYGVDEGLLDDSLSKSRRARTGTIRLLISLCRTLTKRLLPLIHEDQRSKLYLGAGEVSDAIERLRLYIEQDAQDSDSDTGSDDVLGDNEDPYDIAEDLKIVVQCLLDLGYRFQEQAVRYAPRRLEEVPVPSQVQNELPVKRDPVLSIFTDHIRTRYPACRPDLIELLGKAQRDRIIRCQEARRRNSQARIAVPSSVETSTTKPASTTFRDSALGSSVPTGSVYAETTISYAGGEGGSISVPSLPEGATRGVPFECIGCDKMVIMMNNTVWKRHLFIDLHPYTCLDKDCKRGVEPFLTRAQWEHHIISHHGKSIPWESIHCPICLEDTPKGSNDASKHISGHLEQISLTALPNNPDSVDMIDIMSNNQPADLATTTSTTLTDVPEEQLKSNKMTSNQRSDFKPTYTFTHPYSDSEVLRHYLIEDIGMKESQFRLKITTGEIQLMLIDKAQRIDQKQIEGIVVSFIDAERKRKLEVARGFEEAI